MPKFKELKIIRDRGEKIKLINISFWLADMTINYLELLLLELRKDIEKYRRIDPNDEPLKFKRR